MNMNKKDKVIGEIIEALLDEALLGKNISSEEIDKKVMDIIDSSTLTESEKEELKEVQRTFRRESNAEMIKIEKKKIKKKILEYSLSSLSKLKESNISLIGFMSGVFNIIENSNLPNEDKAKLKKEQDCIVISIIKDIF